MATLTTDGMPQVVQAHLRHLQRRGLSDRTISDRRGMLKVFSEWLTAQGHGDPRECSLRHLQDFLVHLSDHLSPGARRNYVSMLRTFYRHLYKQREILTNPAAELQFPKAPKRLRRDTLSPSELRQLFAVPGTDTPVGLRDTTLLRLLALSGFRASEVCQIDVDQVSLEEREIILRRGKGKRDRMAFFDVRTRDVLAMYLVQARPLLASSNDRPLLVTTRGNRMHRVGVGRIVDEHVRRAKLRKHITPHSLRRTFCTLMLQAGVNLKAIAELAGHKCLATTATYTKVDITTLSAVYREAHPRGQS